MTRRDDILRSSEAGAISPQIAVAQLVLAGIVPDAADFANATPETPLARIGQLAAEHRDTLLTLARIAGKGLDPVGDDPVAATAALFDWLAQEAPEAAVAFYSLGNAELLAGATAELVAVVADWVPVDSRDVLDLGCGIGRVAIALAPRVRSVLGLDVSAAMVAEARRRAGDVGNVRFETSDGRDLASVSDRGIDLLLAVDSFPYLVRAGAAIVDRHLAEAARVLRPGGDLLVFNWSYRGDPAADLADARALAAAHGFDVHRAGERPFAIWDGTGFHLRRRS